MTELYWKLFDACRNSKLPIILWEFLLLKLQPQIRRFPLATGFLATRPRRNLYVYITIKSLQLQYRYSLKCTYDTGMDEIPLTVDRLTSKA
jgi:hypothetical protein